MKARLIYNPTSGNETILKSVADILDVLELAGYEASAFRTTPEPLSAQNEAKRVAEAGVDLIVAAGGDGTLNEVVNGIAPLAKRPPMAIIPGGTTNDYARALKIPRNDPVAAAKIILKKQLLPMDIGQAGDHYFMNIAGGGSISELTYEVPSEYKSILGYLAYLVKGAEMIPRIKPMNMHLEYDDGVYDGDVTLFLSGLTNSVGGFEQIAPDSELGDGKLSLLIVKGANIAELMVLVAKALNGGKHIHDPKIIYTKTKKLFVKSNDNNQIMINLDGEYGGDAPITLSVLRHHISMFADVDAIPDQSINSETLVQKQAEDNFVQGVNALRHDED
ncbi:diacylglycerol kinase family lipid kinase [Bombilactobacillus thymidiniphilus]|uniref:Diacylglycerol kinase family lipid kinase n=1 Tax=Bombilactobacillus thymidiniphilus TaxID=2923363 RepID=A0ABY4PBU5_9LACO|nr:diacylglycerol kinase family lipid kinase [Bombilactobacillus thymidiniphilus]UQS83238.1 diacylglycerol kinase family lipid kinase [Bombilactobacillus thymidiniphilus]